MEFDRDTSPPFDPKSCSLATPTPNSSPPDFATNVSPMYHSMLQSKVSLATEQRLNQARLVLEHQQLSDHYDICLSRLQDITREIQTLQRQNADLRLANTALIKLLTNSFNYPYKEVLSWFSPKSVMEQNRFQKVNGLGRHYLPKSISTSTNSYMNANQTDSTDSELFRRQLEKREEERKGMEMEMYNQGMWKTELCNKWEATGTCLYGENCQFAHGIAELRPVIRHPKYKTQVCRMVLQGEACPYGHRCHFRHSLTQQERLLLPRLSTLPMNSYNNIG